MKKITIQQLNTHNPCSEGKAFLSGCKTAKKAWETCSEPGWMFWALAQVRPLSKVESVTLACAFARRVLNRYEEKNPSDAPRKAIEAAEAWLREQTPAAESAAWIASNAARSAARSAESAASNSARSAESAAWSAAWIASNAAWSAAWSAESAASNSARSAAASAAASAAKKAQCDIIRQIVKVNL